MAPKFSLITISYCTVFDLSAAIDYAYRALDSSVKSPHIIGHLLQDFSIFSHDCFGRFVLWFRHTTSHKDLACQIQQLERGRVTSEFEKVSHPLLHWVL